MRSLERATVPIMSRWFREYGWGPVAPALATGSYPQDGADDEVLRAAGITAVVSLCRDRGTGRGRGPWWWRRTRLPGIVEHRLPSEDYGGLRPELLERGAVLVGAALDAGATVYVHCRAGWQRSAAVAAAALVVRDGVDVPAALEAIRRSRPEAAPLPHQVADLSGWAAGRQGA